MDSSSVLFTRCYYCTQIDQYATSRGGMIDINLLKEKLKGRNHFGISTYRREDNSNMELKYI
jgi:hypothetical protein